MVLLVQIMLDVQIILLLLVHFYTIASSFFVFSIGRLFNFIYALLHDILGKFC
jgi:hypothetical protein